MNYAQGNLSPNVAIVPGQGAIGSRASHAEVGIDPAAIAGMLNLFGVLTPMQKLQRQYAEEGAKTLAQVMGLYKEAPPQPGMNETAPPPNGTNGMEAGYAEKTAPVDQWLDQSTAVDKSNSDAIKGLASLLMNPQAAGTATEKTMGFPIARIMAEYTAAKDAGSMTPREMINPDPNLVNFSQTMSPEEKQAALSTPGLYRPNMRGTFDYIGQPPPKNEFDAFLAKNPDIAKTFADFQAEAAGMKKGAETTAETQPLIDRAKQMGDVEAYNAALKTRAVGDVQLGLDYKRLPFDARKTAIEKMEEQKAQIAAYPDKAADLAMLKNYVDKNGNRIQPNVYDPATKTTRPITNRELAQKGAIALPDETITGIQTAKTGLHQVQALRNQLENFKVNNPGMINLMGNMTRAAWNKLTSENPQLELFESGSKALVPAVVKMQGVNRLTEQEIKIYSDMVPQFGPDSLPTVNAKLDRLADWFQNQITTATRTGEEPAQSGGKNRFKILSVK